MSRKANPLDADWYQTCGPSKGWKPSGVGIEDTSRAARARAIQQRMQGGAIHGTNTRYNKGCRCASCKSAGASYARARRARRALAKAVAV